jgi:RNA polymerase sigma-70 factor (ECF subfamily)
MIQDDGDTTELIGRVDRGDLLARERLLYRIRSRLRPMIAARIDRRLAPRVDPSDVVQETLAEADRSLETYVRNRPIPFMSWLRRLAWERLVEATRRHIGSSRRSVSREEPGDRCLPERSGAGLSFLRSNDSSPSRRAIRGESCGHVRAVLAELSPQDRELLLMRYYEQCSIADIAAALRISPGAVMARHTRALARLRSRLDGTFLEGQI